MGTEFSHTVCALDNRFDAASRLNNDVAYTAMAGPSYKDTMRVVRLFYDHVRAQRPNLILTYNWGAIDGLLGSLCAHVCPIIHLEDGFGPDESTTLKRRRVLTRRVLLNRIHKTIVPSKTLSEIARQRFRVKESKVQYIANGVDIERFRPGNKTEARRSLGLDQTRILFGFVGQLRPEKNLPLLLKAFAAATLPSAALLLLGEGESESLLRKLVRDLNIEDRVTLTGLIKDPAPYLQAFDVFAMSSVTEQMPISLLEAMACALPAVCTDVGDTADILGGTANLVIAPGRVPEYAAALQRLAADENLRHQLGDANRTRCVENYSLNRMVEQHRDAYRTAVRGWRSPAAND